MTASRYVTIWCDGDNADDGDPGGLTRHADGCEEWIGHGYTAADARAEARVAGWVNQGRRDFSPACWSRRAVLAPTDPDVSRVRDHMNKES